MSGPARGVRAVGKARLYVEDTGGDRPLVVFAHGLMMSTEMYRAQIAALRDRYRCVAFDFRGQGESPLAASGYDMDTLTGDAAALIESLGAGPAHWVGLSMGGFVGLRMAARRPDLVRSLVLLESSAEPEPVENVGRYRLLAAATRVVPARLLTSRVAPIMFGKTILADRARRAELDGYLTTMTQRRDIWRAVSGVVERAGVEAELARITAPTTIIVGDEDVATPPAKAARMAAGIAGARLVTIAGAGHSSSVEQPAAVTAAIAAHLTQVSAGPSGTAASR